LVVGYHHLRKELRDEQELGPGYEGIAEFFDLFANNADIPFYVRYAKKQGSPVLDIAAGAGRVTFPLAQEGLRVTALEKSPSMLTEMRRKLLGLPKDAAQRVNIVEADMSDFSIGRKYRLIIIPGSFAHAMSTDKQLSTLKCVRKHLASDGLFILDLHVGALLPEDLKFEEPQGTLPDGRTVIRSGVIHTDMVRQIMKVNLKYTVIHASRNHGEEKQEIEVTSGAAVIFNREADLLVRMAGLAIEEELGGFDGRAYTPECDRRILLLRTH
jgi:SAM-dependent methyltransferase